MNDFTTFFFTELLGGGDIGCVGSGGVGCAGGGSVGCVDVSGGVECVSVVVGKADDISSFHYYYYWCWTGFFLCVSVVLVPFYSFLLLRLNISLLLELMANILIFELSSTECWLDDV